MVKSKDNDSSDNDNEDNENTGDIELAPKVERKEQGEIVEDESSNKKKSTSTYRELLQYPNAARFVLGYFFISMMAVIYDEVIPLWCQSSIHRGGLEYTSREVRRSYCFLSLSINNMNRRLDK